MLDIVPLEVNLQHKDGSIVQGLLEIATEADMHQSWGFYWLENWKGLEAHKSEFYAFIKLSSNDKVLGLMEVEVFPIFSGSIEAMDFIQISMIETVFSRDRMAKPVGKWLIWYACHLAKILCKGNDSGSIVELNAGRFGTYYYYRSLGMEDMGHPQFPSSPEMEDKFIKFRFTRTQAEDFCQQLQDQYGKPRILTDWKPKTFELEADPVH